MRYLNLGCGEHFRRDWTNVDFRSRDAAVQAHDITQGLSFAAASFDVVYHSHLLEHLRREQVAAFLSECHRVLRPGGVMRVVVPDLERIARAYLAALDAGDAANHEWTVLEMYDQAVRETPGGEMVAVLSRQPLPNEAFILERCGAEAAAIIDASRSRAGSRSKRRRLARAIDAIPLLRDLRRGRFRRSGEVHHWMYDRLSLGRLLQSAGFADIRLETAATSRIAGWPQFELDTDGAGNVRKPDSLFMEGSKPS
ncbi:MAG TPA: methyltransferase domain-containing protein [Thermoanaerobaculia bacterium]|jgi:predicted SAM-dependent methyltransferase|nr:methyltransferase domain-containing protein [Thermoanaerobaculia bacterium]